MVTKKSKQQQQLFFNVLAFNIFVKNNKQNNFCVGARILISLISRDKHNVLTFKILAKTLNVIIFVLLEQLRVHQEVNRFLNAS